MSGMFGILLGRNQPFPFKNIKEAVSILTGAAQTRGKGASGVMLYNEANNTYSIFKGHIPLTDLVRNPAVKASLQEQSEASAGGSHFILMGHSQLASKREQRSADNIQPIVNDGLIALHCGIIVNDVEIREKYPLPDRSLQTDAEICPSLTDYFIKNGEPTTLALRKMNAELEGTASIATVFADSRKTALLSNDGALYILTNRKDVVFFASEEYTLKTLARKYGLTGDQGFEMKHIDKDTICIVDFSGDIGIDVFDPNSCLNQEEKSVSKRAAAAAIKITAIENPNAGSAVAPAILDKAAKTENTGLSSLLEHDAAAARTIKRCSKCLLPVTFPFISFDKDGVCNYCRNYKIKNKPRDISELMRLIEPYRSRDGSPDCIVPFSGGRDSTYAMHIIKNELKLNPVAFTYDWGMVTDLARRNIARVCGKLGVENIVVAADIDRKRLNVRKNLAAWLQKPHLGMLPLLMAGDKYFYYYVEKVKRETGIKLNLWGVNPMENTDFKVGFLGVSPDFEKRYIYSLSAGRKIKLLFSVLSIAASNPRYINSSIWDTTGSFFSRSIMPHRDYFHVFDYFRWDEKEIDELITREYSWEKAPDTTTTWRIGDGTAAFYNYVYFTVAGFSEHDTFRSNQIREGAITRDEAFEMVMRENEPRYETIKWYLDVVGMDFSHVIRTVNSIPRLY